MTTVTADTIVFGAKVTTPDEDAPGDETAYAGCSAPRRRSH